MLPCAALSCRQTHWCMDQTRCFASERGSDALNICTTLLLVMCVVVYVILSFLCGNGLPLLSKMLLKYPYCNLHPANLIADQVLLLLMCVNIMCPYLVTDGLYTVYNLYISQTLPVCLYNSYDVCFDATADQRPSPRKQGSGMEHNAGRHPSPHKEPVATVKPVHTLNPINVVGKVLKAGASVAQEVPNQALGRAMGAAGGPRSRHHLTPPRAEVQTQDEATAVEDELSYGSHQAAAVGDGRQSSQHQAAAGAKNDRSNPAADRDVHDASRQPQSSNSSHHSPHGQDSEPSGWDKSVQQGRVKHSKSKVSSSGNSREVNRPSVSDGSLSKKETGPMQYIYSRGGKLAATFAMAMASKKGNPAGASNSTSQSQDQHRDQQNQANQAGDVEMGNAAPRNGSATDNNNSMPGSDTVSKHGAGDPNAAAGGQV